MALTRLKVVNEMLDAEQELGRPPNHAAGDGLEQALAKGGES